MSIYEFKYIEAEDESVDSQYFLYANGRETGIAIQVIDPLFYDDIDEDMEDIEYTVVRYWYCAPGMLEASFHAPGQTSLDAAKLDAIAEFEKSPVYKEW